MSQLPGDRPAGQSAYVIKIGGNVIDDEDALSLFLANLSIAVNKNESSAFILVHGGGKIATNIGDKLGIRSNYVNGRRITDDDTINLVTMVYGGLVNKQIVARLQSAGINAVGLTGADANLIPAVKRPVKEVDFGWVGDVAAADINVDILSRFMSMGLLPVFAPLTHDTQGHILNTNADTIASSLAVALSSTYHVRLLYCFEKKGVLENVDDENSVINSITKLKYAELLAANRLFAGILPKLDNAFAAIDAGVKEVLIGHANDLVQNTSAHTVGTLIQNT
ncbi:acetylglutamate kinase [Segetibacter sp. 3557_3]|uniref:acetylglutamate kinase n=1 Tax=Segetibacter sp. 3557_3 TaxID=2547429 RepID=UPI0010591D1E|nr:acetylglutamate kinase [Segetibacter sp. 3557_3]TDH25107.1 acetylglutamate kinase [Segetibacter sp. 3557_3]